MLFDPFPDSAKAFVEWIANPMANNGTYRWQCVFLPDNGAFFVNYIITSAFIGTSLELIRFPELFLYIIRLGLARSKAEIASVRRAILYEFQFGVQYAWMLLIFAMTIIYSLSCPIITPFGEPQLSILEFFQFFFFCQFFPIVSFSVDFFFFFLPHHHSFWWGTIVNTLIFFFLNFVNTLIFFFLYFVNTLIFFFLYFVNTLIFFFLYFVNTLIFFFLYFVNTLMFFFL